MRSRLLALALVSTIVAATGGPAHAALVTQVPDEKGDVTIVDRPGPSTSARKSIDLRSFKISTVDGPAGPGSSVRFSFRIKDITTAPDLVQDLRVLLTDAEPGYPKTSGEVIVRVQTPRDSVTSASVEMPSAGSGTSCGGMLPRINKRAGVVKFDVSVECLPPGEVYVRVVTTTRDLDRSRLVYSRDVAKASEPVDLHGMAGEDD